MADLFIYRLRRPYVFESPLPGREYAAWILSNDPSQSAAERDAISAALVATGCRYAVCSGYECSKWDDCVDWAFLEASPELDPPDEKFVMTSWREDQSIGDVAEFFIRHTAFDAFQPSAFVIVSVGEDATTEQAITAVRRLLGTSASIGGSP